MDKVKFRCLNNSGGYESTLTVGEVYEGTI
jgi:hypothetical protein